MAPGQSDKLIEPLNNSFDDEEAGLHESIAKSVDMYHQGDSMGK